MRISGTRGSPPPPTAKVAINFLGGYRNTMTLVLTGLDIEEKAAWAEQELFGILGGRDQFADVDVRLLRFDRPDAPTNEQATAHLRITVKDPDPRKVGRRFSNATMELALGGYAGFHTTTPPTPESAYGVYWPALVPAAERAARGGPAGRHAPCRSRPPPLHPRLPRRETPPRRARVPPGTGRLHQPDRPPWRAPLGRICAARSGDKGGNANVGIWTRDPAAYAWLRDYLTVERLRTLLPEAAGLDVRRFELPNLQRAQLRHRRPAGRGRGLLDPARPPGQGPG